MQDALKALSGHSPGTRSGILFVVTVCLMFAAPLDAADNILLIIADDFGVDSHGLYGVGSSTAPTPAIDSLAAQGIRFDRAWSNPVCSPTRATIITGRYSFRTGMGWVVIGHDTHLPASEYTVADALGSLGYSTAVIGKWHLGAANEFLPTNRGFDYFAGSSGGGLGAYSDLTAYFNWTKTENEVSYTVTNYATTENVDDAIRWINDQESSNPNKPWFVWLAFNAPHAPTHKPPNELHSYDYLPGTAADIEQNPQPYYQAMVESMDTEINRLLNAIDRSNTNIIFIGDNGTWRPDMVPPADVWRDKGSLHEGGIWIPWIVSGPAVTLPNRTSGALVNTADLFATIIELAGGDVADLVPAGTPIDSVSILPLLENPGQDDLCQYVFAERFRDPTDVEDGKTIRNDQYKLIRLDLGGEGFYRMSNDLLQYPADEVDNLLDGMLDATEQANYDALSSKLDSLLIGNDTDRLCDADGDGAPNTQDNCPTTPNPGQEDTDGDGAGDACDDDDDNDGLLDTLEQDLGTNPNDVDSDDDGLVDGAGAVVPLAALPDGIDIDSDGFVDGEQDLGTDPTFSNIGDVGPRGAPDNTVNVGDLVVLTRLVMGLTQTTALELILADTNSDGQLNAADIMLLLQKILNGSAP